jgi:DNA-binding response OmpR family regulator
LDNSVNIANKPRVLLVEDEWLAYTALQSIFTRRGWQILVATTLQKALTELDNKPDWVVLDLMLPDGDGLEVLRAVRNRKLAVRVAVTSGVSDPERLKEVEDLRPDAFFVKPIDTLQLITALSH